MPRITLLPDAELGLFGRVAAWFARRKLGRVPGPLRAMAHSPTALRAYAGFEFSFEKFAKVDPRLMSLAVLRTATLVGCSF